METAKKYVLILAAGGLFGILGQLFFTVLGLIPGLEPRFAVYGTLILMGVFTLCTFPFGWYQRIAEKGGFAAMLTFSGLAAAVAESFENTKRASGKAGKAALAGVVMFLCVIGIGSVVVLVITLFLYYVVWGGSLLTATAQLITPELAMSFVYAFWVCGVLSVLFHLFMEATKLAPPHLLVIGFSLGTLLVPLGALDWLQALGGAGAFTTVMAAGGATGGALFALFSGNPLPLIEIAVVFVSLVALGILAGALRVARTPRS